MGEILNYRKGPEVPESLPGRPWVITDLGIGLLRAYMCFETCRLAGKLWLAAGSIFYCLPTVICNSLNFVGVSKFCI